MEFPHNGIVNLLDLHPTHNLGESTGVDLMLFELLDEAAMERLHKVRLGYGSSQGEPELRGLIAKMLGMGDDDVLVTHGGSAAFVLLALCVMEPGDHTIVTSPNFPPTLDTLTAFGTNCSRIELTFDAGYALDPDRMKQAIRADTELVHLTSPANPSGTEVPPETVAAIADDLASRAPGAVLVVDESYRQARHGTRPERPSYAGSAPNMVVTGSLSKCHGAPGLRTGWIATSDRELLEAVKRAKLNVLVSNSVVDEFLAVEVLRRSDEILSHRAEVLEAGRLTVGDWVAANEDGVEWIEPVAGALCTIRLKPHIDADAFRDELRANDAMVGDGAWFSTEPGVFRIGFGYLPLEQLPAALDAVGNSLRAARQ